MLFSIANSLEWKTEVLIPGRPHFYARNVKVPENTVIRMDRQTDKTDWHKQRKSDEVKGNWYST